MITISINDRLICCKSRECLKVSKSPQQHLFFSSIISTFIYDLFLSVFSRRLSFCWRELQGENHCREECRLLSCSFKNKFLHKVQITIRKVNNLLSTHAASSVCMIFPTQSFVLFRRNVITLIKTHSNSSVSEEDRKE